MKERRRPVIRVLVRNHHSVLTSSSSSSSSSLSSALISAAEVGTTVTITTALGTSSPRHPNIFILLRRLLIPFFVLVSTTCCTTTTSLSTFGNNKGIVEKSSSYSRTGSGGSGCSSSSITNFQSKHAIKSSNNNNKIKGSIHKNKPDITKENNSHNIPHTSKNKQPGNDKVIDNNTLSQKEDHIHNNIKNGKNNTNNNNNNNNGNGNNNNDEMAARSLIPGLAEEDQKFLDRVQGSLRTVTRWEDDKDLLEECRSQIPWKELVDDYDYEINDNNEIINEKYSNYDVDRLLRGGTGGDSNALFLQRLCRWFPSFMSWVNAPPCKVCGCEDMEMKTVRGPETTEELEGQAKRVEVYYCPECKDNTTTFPRYNLAKKLLETRQGRCGEYSNLFGLFCRSVGFETRLVLDWSDHLWTEVRLGDSWIMADGCEGIIDKPSMYEHGWGKDGLCYMVGIGRDHVVDVTPRYTRQFMTEDFQTRRRGHTSSEESSDRILNKLNDHLRPTVARTRVEELIRRHKLEEAELQQCKQGTGWTDQEMYGSGRISGSLAWKQSRQEAGGTNQQTEEESNNNTIEEEDGDEGGGDQNVTKSRTQEVAGFPVEAFIPPTLENGKVNFQLHPRPSSRHDGIVVSNTPCAVGVTNSISMVVVDNDKSLGCILQSKSFVDWSKLVDFVDELPTGRIVLINGKIDVGNETKAEDIIYKEVIITRLGGWDGKEVMKKGVLFVGQIDANPDWTVCTTLDDDTVINGYEIEIETENGGGRRIPSVSRRLRTERAFMPQRIAGRLPEAFMPLSQQVKADEKEKRKAYLKFTESHAGRYCGYTTKKHCPVYLLDSTSYPLQRIEPVAAEILEKENTWNTFLELPEPLVPNNDCGIDDAPPDTASSPLYDVPLDSSFFNSSFGSNLLSNVNLKTDTADTLTNARLIGLYFSAHW
jgi:peptide-N4-(N-acetyl-beta-glucosaminyl)asparagine amidase